MGPSTTNNDSADAARKYPLQGQNLTELWDFNLTNHKPTSKAIEKIERLREAAKAYVNAIIELTPQSREQSLALTNTETANFYAVAAIARKENEDVKDATN